MKRTVLLSCLLLSVTACDIVDSGITCTSDLRSSPTGNIRDEAGNPVTATRVVRSDGRSEYDCNVEAGYYDCFEQGGGSDVEITVFAGGQQWSQTVDIPHNGCHEEPVTLDFVLDGLPICDPAIAVEGDLTGPSQTPLRGASVTLSRTADGVFGPSVNCEVETAHYVCPAIGLFDPGNYTLEVSFGVTWKRAELHIDAASCDVETKRYDFDFVD